MQCCTIVGRLFALHYYLAVCDGELLEKGDIVVAIESCFGPNGSDAYLIPHGTRTGKHLYIRPIREFLTPLNLAVDHATFLENKESVRVVKPDWALRRAGYKRVINDAYPPEEKVWRPVNPLSIFIRYRKNVPIKFNTFTPNGCSVWTTANGEAVRLSNELIFGYYLTYREIKRKRAKIFRALNADAP